MTAEAKSRCVRLSQVHSAGGQTPVRDVLPERDVQPHQEEQLHHPLGELHTHTRALSRSGSLITPKLSDPKLVITRPLPPPSSSARQPSGVLPHQENAARRPVPEAHHRRAAGGRVLHQRLRPHAPAHHVSHHTPPLLHGPLHGNGAQPEAPTHCYQQQR